jgi:hypothetical protein
MRLLSPVNILRALVAPVGLLVILVIFLTTTNEALTATLVITSLIFFLILSAWIYDELAHTYDLYYDQQYVHLKGIRKRKMIPLAQVKRIQRTYGHIQIAGFNFKRYTITFDPATDIDDQNIFLASQQLDLFVKAVRRCNKHIVVNENTRRFKGRHRQGTIFKAPF